MVFGVPARQNRVFSAKMQVFGADFGAAGAPKTVENRGKNVRNHFFLNFGHRECHEALVCARAMLSDASSSVRKLAQTFSLVSGIWSNCNVCSLSMDFNDFAV